jgi:chaperonin GroES
MPDNYDIESISVESNPEKMKPIGNQVVIKLEPLPEKTESGLYLPVDSKAHEHCQGTVVAMGPGKVAPKTGIRYPMELKVGDKVLIGRFGGANFDFEGQTYRIINEEQVYCVIEE